MLEIIGRFFKLSILPKVFEIIITKKISNLLSNNISRFQHDFLAKHIIQTNLLLYQNFLIESLDQGYSVLCDLYRFSKGF
jgi:hypothetical protein